MQRNSCVVAVDTVKLCTAGTHCVSYRGCCDDQARWHIALERTQVGFVRGQSCSHNPLVGRLFVVVVGVAVPFHSETPNRKRSRPRSGRGMSAVPSARRRSQRTRPRAQGEAARYPPTTARGRSRPRRRPRPRRPPTRSLGSGTVCMMSRRRPSRPQGVRRPGETPFLVHLASSLAVTMYP